MSEYAVFCGLDVGKEAHNACALDPEGRRLFDAELPQDETRLRGLLTDLQRLGVSWWWSTNRTRSGRCRPGLHPGTAKTDARDAYVISDAARVMPHTLRRSTSGRRRWPS